MKNLKSLLIFSILMLIFCSVASTFVISLNASHILSFLIVIFLYSSIVSIVCLLYLEFKIKASNDTCIETDSNNTVTTTTSSEFQNDNAKFTIVYNDFLGMMYATIASLVFLALLTLADRPHATLLNNVILFVSHNQMGFYLLSSLLFISCLSKWINIKNNKNWSANRNKVYKSILLAISIFGLLSSMYVSIFVLSVLLVNYIIGSFNKLMPSKLKLYFTLIVSLGLLVKFIAIITLQQAAVRNDIQLVSLITFITFLFSIILSVLIFIINYVKIFIDVDSEVLESSNLVTLEPDANEKILPKIKKGV